MSEYKICAFCGKTTKTTHHLVFGVSNRKLADEDGLTIPLCDMCHNLAIKPADRVHGNSVAEKLSKMLGQAMWECDYIAKSLTADDDTVEKEKNDARDNFIKRYGRSYL